MNYRNEVLRTAANHLNDRDKLLMATIGLCGEAGEVAELIKKHVFHKTPLDRAKLLKELGDVRWYFELLCDIISTDIVEVEELNVAKLRARYPDEFTSKDSVERKDEC